MAANILAQKVVPDLRAERAEGGNILLPSAAARQPMTDKSDRRISCLPFRPSARSREQMERRTDGRTRTRRASQTLACARPLLLLTPAQERAADVEFSRVRHHRRRLRHRVTQSDGAVVTRKTGLSGRRNQERKDTLWAWRYGSGSRVTWRTEWWKGKESG